MKLHPTSCYSFGKFYYFFWDGLKGFGRQQSKPEAPVAPQGSGLAASGAVLAAAQPKGEKSDYSLLPGGHHTTTGLLHPVCSPPEQAKGKNTCIILLHYSCLSIDLELFPWRLFCSSLCSCI